MKPTRCNAYDKSLYLNCINSLLSKFSSSFRLCISPLSFVVVVGIKTNKGKLLLLGLHLYQSNGYFLDQNLSQIGKRYLLDWNVYFVLDSLSVLFRIRICFRPKLLSDNFVVCRSMVPYHLLIGFIR